MFLERLAPSFGNTSPEQSNHAKPSELYFIVESNPAPPATHIEPFQAIVRPSVLNLLVIPELSHVIPSVLRNIVPLVESIPTAIQNDPFHADP